MKRGAKQEIEVKLRVEDAAAMRRLLRRLGGRVKKRVHEMNTLFDTPQGTLRMSGRLMRLREETTLQGKGSGTPSHSFGTSGDQGSLRFAQGKQGLEKNRGIRGQGKARVGARYVLTFKWPAKFDGERQEAPAPSRALGTSKSRRYVQGRYKVREETEFIVSDPRAVLALVGQAGMRSIFRYEKYRSSYRVPRAGRVHVEFDETPAGTFLELEGPRRAIDRMARRLGYRPEDYITVSYVALHWDDCRRRGVRAGDMVFRPRKK
jgi:adenylate cyclase class IV